METLNFYCSSSPRFQLLQHQQQEHRRKGYQPNIYLREWAIKTELKYRARIYDPLEQQHELEEHKSIENQEFQTPPQPPVNDGAKTEQPSDQADSEEKEDEERPERVLDKDKPVPGEEVDVEAQNAKAEEDVEGNKSSLVNFSNQMVISIGKIQRRLLSPRPLSGLTPLYDHC